MLVKHWFKVCFDRVRLSAKPGFTSRVLGLVHGRGMVGREDCRYREFGTIRDFDTLRNTVALICKHSVPSRSKTYLSG